VELYLRSPIRLHGVLNGEARKKCKLMTMQCSDQFLCIISNSLMFPDVVFEYHTRHEHCYCIIQIGVDSVHEDHITINIRTCSNAKFLVLVFGAIIRVYCVRACI